MSNTIGLLIMTYGSPESAEDIEEYLKNIRGGKPPGKKMVEEFTNRYEAIGGSPLTEITREQARETADKVEPYVGMRYFEPYIDDAVDEMARDGIERAVGLIMSPQYSPELMNGYVDDLDGALEERDDAPDVHLVRDWWEEPRYHEAVANRINEALEEYDADRRDDVQLLLTAHSIPRSTYEKDPDYIDNLKETARRIVDNVDHTNWEFAYQSAGHTKEEWLKPDMTDLFPGMVEDGYEDVLIAPFQFLADHLEILYDIDIAAKEQAEEAGLNFKRINSLNTYPPFIEAVANVARDAMEREDMVPAQRA
jgi:ferrochelatase